ALNSGVCLILVFLVVIVHLVSDCTHLTRCPKLLVRIILTGITDMQKAEVKKCISGLISTIRLLALNVNA
ncbi:hypothetical protein KW441_21450, partial [Vibrio fluvialis]|nr:hypothetical protein [Vibrio fluvialis]